jgi:hypothetical protein
MGDLELIRLAKIRDERDDRVEELEGAVGNLQSWRQELDGYIDDIRYDLHRLSKVPATQPRHPSPQACRELAAAAHSGGFTVDWPDGHRVDSTTRGAGLWYGDDHSPKPGQWYAHCPSSYLPCCKSFALPSSLSSSSVLL